MSAAQDELADLPAAWVPGQHAVYLQRYPAGRRVVVRLEVAGPPAPGGIPLLALTREGELDLEMLWLAETTADPPRVQMRRANATRGKKVDAVALEHAVLVEALVRDALAAGRPGPALASVPCDAKRFGVSDALVHETTTAAGRVRYLLSPRCALLGVLEVRTTVDRGDGVAVSGLQLLAQGGGPSAPVVALDDLRRVDLGGFTVEKPRAWLPRRRGVEIPGRFEPLYTSAWFLKDGGPGQSLEGSLAHYSGAPEAVEARAAFVADQDADAQRRRGARFVERKEVAGPHQGTITRYRSSDAGREVLHVGALLVRADRGVLADVKLSLSLDLARPGADEAERAFSRAAARAVETVRFAAAP